MDQISLGINNEVEHFELHNYHKTISAKADNETATKELNKKLAELQTPVVHQIHQFTETSHKQQNNPTVNKNNEKVAARVKNDFEAIKIDDNLSLEEKENQRAKLEQGMKKQMTDAAKRTPEGVGGSGIVVTDTDNTPAWPPRT